ncbi:MAG: ORF6N domain-containing protein [Ectothiorhodospiraceae bacterium]|jgi:hypothetical protein
MSVRPIEFDGLETLSFRQLDQLNGLAKGGSFRAFKRLRAQLCEGVHYFVLDAAEYPDRIESLRRDGRIYPATVNLVLITRRGYEAMRHHASPPTSHNPADGER